MLPQVSRRARITRNRAFVGFSGGIGSVELTDFALQVIATQTWLSLDRFVIGVCEETWR